MIKCMQHAGAVMPQHEPSTSQRQERVVLCHNLIFGTAGPHDRRSPSLGADLAALFPTMGSLEGRQVMSQLGSGPANSDTPQPSAASSLDRILSDLGSSDVLQERK